MSEPNDYYKILLISDSTWSDSNNIGNTFSNLFNSWPSDKIAMIYARPDLPQTKICTNYFQISEGRMIASLANRKVLPGIKLSSQDLLKNTYKDNISSDNEFSIKKLYKFFTKYRWNIFLLAREILWKICKWKTNKLDEYIETFNPDVIFSLACSSIYMNKLQQYAISKSKSKSILYFVDDVYSTKRFAISPLFWINKLLIRRSIRETVKICDLVYTIVPMQKKEYDKEFNINSKILTKGGVFKETSKPKFNLNSPILLLYAGNIYAGRFKMLLSIGRALDNLNKNIKKTEMHIYTKNQLSTKSKKKLECVKSIKFMGSLEANMVTNVLDDADILIHVESLRLKHKLVTRLSFSTKIVDYFQHRKCIFAVGWGKSASIEYLKRNNAAVVIEKIKTIETNLKQLVEKPSLILEYGDNAWECGRRNHNIEIVKKSLMEDIKQLVSEQ
jgi:hypothetical protein